MPTTTAAYSALQAIRVRKQQMEAEGTGTHIGTAEGRDIADLSREDQIDRAEGDARADAIRAESLSDRGLDSGGQYQDADAARSADPVERRETAMSQMDQTAAVESGAEQPGAMASMPGQQGGKDALAASNKTSAEGAAAVAQIEAMAGGGPRQRPSYVQSANPYAASQMPSARGVPTSNLFKRQFRRF